MRFINYVWTTFVGIAPGAFVFAQAGRGLNQILKSDEGFTLSALFNFKIKVALIGLGVIALIPILIKKLRKKKDMHD